MTLPSAILRNEIMVGSDFHEGKERGTTHEVGSARHCGHKQASAATTSPKMVSERFVRRDERDKSLEALLALVTIVREPLNADLVANPDW